jgi:exodeoxyribonuclease III
VRLITWNVNSLRARMPRVVELLEEHAPDVLCLQETKCSSAAFPHAALAELGYRAVEHSEGRWNGVALVVPADVEPAEVLAGLPGEPTVTGARWIEATIGGVRVVSVYVPNGRDPQHPMFTAKLDFLEAARDRLEVLVAAGPTVLAGDVNIAPEDRDVWDPAVFVGSTHVTPDERARLRAIEAVGLVDAYRAVDPEGTGYTYWDYRLGALRRNLGMRIDLVLVSHQLVVTSCEVDGTYRRVNRAGDKPSDHAPLLAELERPAGG